MGSSQVLFCHLTLRENRTHILIFILFHRILLSYPSKEDNEKILQNISRHLKPQGKAVISVMNYDCTAAIAKHKRTTPQIAEALRQLKPSNTMQSTGDIFDPDYFLLDSDTQIVYRKEQFLNLSEAALPFETVVLDRRFRISELISLCAKVGLTKTLTRPVQAGHWDRELNATDKSAKELLFFGEKAPLP